MKMKITATGDSILSQGYKEGGYEGQKPLQDFIARGDAKFGNLEICITDWSAWGSTYCGGLWMSTTPDKLHQIVDYGFNFMGFANNLSPKKEKEYAEKGSCVIIGRCADYVLREKRNVVKVFIHAPLDDRIRRKMALGTEGSTEKEVKKNILTKEKVRERYYNFYTGSRWGDSRNYNLCIDTSKVGIDGAVEIIAAYVEHERQHSILPD